ncbi:DNA primase large subunit [Geopyxis carbonaria]|nr:DNA primase large subunit [Geopyxis carbonaria]
MYRQTRKRAFEDTRKKHFSSSGPSGSSGFKSVDYPHRLNFYSTPPTAEITLDQFETWAIARLSVLGEIESCMFRNKSPAELRDALAAKLKTTLPLASNSSRAGDALVEQRRMDHYSHFILRLAFARSEELRRRFAKAETVLFRYRFETDDVGERRRFVAEQGLEWEPVPAEEVQRLAGVLRDVNGGRKIEEEYFRVEWEKVPDLVEGRKVLLRGGMAYVPASLQLSMVAAEFTARLERALALTARALPRLDEDDRLIPILNHLSLGFTAPEYTPSSTPTLLSGTALTASQIDSLLPHFPACMTHLHRTLRRTAHLKHFGRLQYTLFLKGLGLSIDECLLFWRQSFRNIAEDAFNKEYRYNVRHAYGLEGNRRDYKPKSCQQILTETPPGSGEAHGCPYRHFEKENLLVFLRAEMGVNDAEVLRGVERDVGNKGFHVACNRVFEFRHRKELEKEREAAGAAAGSGRQTLVHPNEYMTRSWELTHPELAAAAAREGRVKKEEEGQDTPMM